MIGWISPGDVSNTSNRNIGKLDILWVILGLTTIKHGVGLQLGLLWFMVDISN